MLSLKQRIYLIESFFQKDSIHHAQDNFSKKYGNKNVPSITEILHLVHQFSEFGSVLTKEECISSTCPLHCKEEPPILTINPGVSY